MFARNCSSIVNALNDILSFGLVDTDPDALLRVYHLAALEDEKYLIQEENVLSRNEVCYFLNVQSLECAQLLPWVGVFPSQYPKVDTAARSTDFPKRIECSSSIPTKTSNRTTNTLSLPIRMVFLSSYLFLFRKFSPAEQHSPRPRLPHLPTAPRRPRRPLPARLPRRLPLLLVVGSPFPLSRSMFSSLFSTLERGVALIDTYFDDILSSASSRSISLESDHPVPTSPSLLAWLSAAQPPPAIEPLLCVPHVLTAVLAWMEGGLSADCAENARYDRSCVVDVLEFFKSHNRLPDSLDGQSALCRLKERRMSDSRAAVRAGELRRRVNPFSALRYASPRHAAIRNHLPDPHAAVHSPRSRSLLQSHPRKSTHHALPDLLLLYLRFHDST